MTNIIICPNFIDLKTCDELNSWVLDMFNSQKMSLWSDNYYIAGYRFFDPSNEDWEIDQYGRRLKPMRNIPNSFFEIREKIKKCFDFKNEYERKTLTMLISLLEKNGYVNKHIDSGVEGHTHMRANLILNCDDKAACPMIENRVLNLNKGDLIVFPADKIEHSTTVQESEFPRVIVSYAFLIPD